MSTTAPSLHIHIFSDGRVEFDGVAVDATLPANELLAPYVAHDGAVSVHLRNDEPTDYELIGKFIYGCTRAGMRLATVNGRDALADSAAPQQ